MGIKSNNPTESYFNFFGNSGGTYPFSATGGAIVRYLDSGSTYNAHIFNSPGSFDVVGSAPFTVEYLVVAGGGSGAGGNNPEGGGGGGGGGYRTATGFAVSAGTSYPVTVGDGGTGGPENGERGENSVFSTITSTGGGGGHKTTGTPSELPGGCGGGGGSSGTAAGADGGPGVVIIRYVV